MSVAAYEHRSSHESMSPLFIIGSRSRFGKDGKAPVSVRSAELQSSPKIPNQNLLRAIVHIAILFHDIGKETPMFQAKLRRVLQGGGIEADPVRHEIYSAFFFDALAAKYGTDDEFLNACSSHNLTSDLDQAHRIAAQKCFDLYENCAFSSGAGSSKIEFNIDGSDSSRIRHSVLQLILTHHRLPSHSDGFENYRSENHVRVDRNTEVSAQDFQVYDSIVHDDDWLRKLRKCTKSAFDHSSDEIIDVALYGRTAMMMADHYGSSQSKKSDGSETLANTKREKGGPIFPGDTLKSHVNKVYGAARMACYTVFGAGSNQYPAVEHGDCAGGILDWSTNGDPRFAWQGIAAQATADLVENEGGFFGCIISGTGTGKTRGAPAILAAATYGHCSHPKSKLRYNLALNLRTLAEQSGREYIHDLGFNVRDVATIVGGANIDWSSIETDESGSEDRLRSLETVDVSLVGTDIPEDGTEDQAWINGLSSDHDRCLPAFAELLMEKSKNKDSSIRLLETPVLSATIDHFMAAADASRGGHIAQMLRVMSSDMVIDEVDLFSEEDLSAISRLAYLVGAFGRKLIIMSATMTHDIATELHASYAAGWKKHAKSFGKSEDVNAICTGDSFDSVYTTEAGISFSECFENSSRKMISALSRAFPKRRSCILDEVSSFSELSRIVDDACLKMHSDHHIEDSGFRISAGLVRLTRIKHVQALARELGPSDTCLRKYIYLHSALPLIQRKNIENTIKTAFTRKGSQPNSKLIRLLKRQGVFEEARDQGFEDISIVVISSPVIETGNDVDFDYAIIDPSSIRAIVQTAGRVNRHRNMEVHAANIALLPEYLVSSIEGKGVVYPGVETPLAKDHEFSPVHLMEGRELVGGFIRDRGSLDVIDARLLADQTIEAPILDAERELRRRFFENFPSTREFRTSSNSRLSQNYNRSRRFRRADLKSDDFIPYFDGDSITGWKYVDPKNREIDTNIVSVDDDLNEVSLLKESLDDLISKVGDNAGFKKEGVISVQSFGQRNGRLLLGNQLGFRME